MKIEQFSPSEILKPYIKTFMIIESEKGMDSKTLPATSLVMAFRLKGQVTDFGREIADYLPISTISGLRKSMRLLVYEQHTANLLVVFQEGGANVFFQEPLHELFGQSISLDSLFPRQQILEIEEKLVGAKNHASRIQLVEKFLLGKLKENKHNQLIFKAIKSIEYAQGNIKIRDLVKDLPISLDPFEKRFRKVIGTSPKQFATIVRWKNLLQLYPKSSNLTDMAHHAGYFDQAHFIKDFKLFTGQTPTDFFKSSNYW